MEDKRESSTAGSDMDIEDIQIEQRFYQEIFQLMFEDDTEEIVDEAEGDMDLEQYQLQSKPAERDRKLEEPMSKKYDQETEKNRVEVNEVTNHDQLEKKTSDPIEEKFLEIAPPILIMDDFLLNLQKNCKKSRSNGESRLHLKDFNEHSEDKWNAIDGAFFKFTMKGKRLSTQQPSPTPSNVAKAVKIVETGISTKEILANANLASLPHASEGTKYIDEKKEKGMIFDDYYPLWGVPKYFDKILEIDEKSFLKKFELQCITKNDINFREKEFTSPVSVAKDEIENEAVLRPSTQKTVLPAPKGIGKNAEPLPTTSERDSSAKNLPPSKSKKKRKKKKKTTSQQNQLVEKKSQESLLQEKTEEPSSESSHRDDECRNPELLNEHIRVVYGIGEMELNTDTSSESDDDPVSRQKLIEELRRVARGDF